VSSDAAANATNWRRAAITQQLEDQSVVPMESSIPLDMTCDG
jgi:hypothetical protein